MGSISHDYPMMHPAGRPGYQIGSQRNRFTLLRLKFFCKEEAEREFRNVFLFEKFFGCFRTSSRAFKHGSHLYDCVSDSWYGYGHCAESDFYKAVSQSFYLCFPDFCLSVSESFMNQFIVLFNFNFKVFITSRKQVVICSVQSHIILYL